MNCNESSSRGELNTSDGLWIGPAKPSAYTKVGYVAPMHLRAWKDCYAKFVDERYLNTSASLIRDEYKKLQKKGYTMWLAEWKGTPVGVAIFGTDLEKPDRGWIEALYVEPAWQRRQDLHVGTRLLKAVIEELGCSEIVLQCAEQNKGGRAFWKAHGFERIGDGRPYPIPGYGELPTGKYLRAP